MIDIDKLIKKIESMDFEEYRGLWNRYCKCEGLPSLIYKSNLDALNKVFGSPLDMANYMMDNRIGSIDELLQEGYIALDINSEVYRFTTPTIDFDSELKPLVEWVIQLSDLRIMNLLGMKSLEELYVRCDMCGERIKEVKPPVVSDSLGKKHVLCRGCVESVRRCGDEMIG